MTPEQLATIIDYLHMGATTDGAHHKQWCLVKVLRLLDAPDSDLYDPGIAP